MINASVAMNVSARGVMDKHASWREKLTISQCVFLVKKRLELLSRKARIFLEVNIGYGTKKALQLGPARFFLAVKSIGCWDQSLPQIIQWCLQSFLKVSESFYEVRMITRKTVYPRFSTISLPYNWCICWMAWSTTPLLHFGRSLISTYLTSLDSMTLKHRTDYVDNSQELFCRPLTRAFSDENTQYRWRASHMPLCQDHQYQAAGYR